MKLTLKDVTYIIIPIVLGFLFSNICKINNTAGEGVPLRPPNWLFPIVWSILYLCIGIAWVQVKHYSNMNKNTQSLVNLLFWILNVTLTGWIIFYSCFNKKEIGPIMILLSFIITLIIMIKTNDLEINLLLAPLAIWLSFVMYLNIYEISVL